MDNKNCKFDLSEDEIRMIALYRKAMMDDGSRRNQIQSIKEAQEFIDKFRVLIDAERAMQANAEIIYRYLHRILGLFHERCTYYGQDSYEHVHTILDSITQGKTSTEKLGRPTIN